MDSLIVLRKPLRKSLLAPTFIIPKKSKKALTKVDPIPSDPNSAQGSSERPISFVKLYKELCVENTRRATPRVHVRDTPRARANSLATRSPSHTSLLTQYRGSCGAGAGCERLISDSMPPVTARAELLMELDYGNSSIGSEFY